MTETHTPLPWASDPMKLGCLGDISTADGVSCIAQVQQIAGDDREQSERRRLTAFIVQAVNSHHRLIEALEDIVNPLGNLRRDAEAEGRQLSNMAYSIANDLSFVQNIARAALKEAGRG